MDRFDAFSQNGEDVDPAAEFLAREQSDLAGLVDGTVLDQPSHVMNGIGLDIKPDTDNLIGTNVGESETDSGFEMVNHETEGVTVNGSTTLGAGAGTLFGGHTGAPATSPIPSLFGTPREEPEKLRRWREDQKQGLAKKDEDEERKRQEMKEAARKELEDWYANHEEQVAKNRVINRNAEKELVGNGEPGEPGTEWERIAKLCDFNPKGTKHQKDISRMRSIILQVKQTPPLPSVTRKT